jgi:hypothetical protein
VVNPLLWFVIAVAAMALVAVLVVRRRALSRLSTPPAVAPAVRLSDRLTRSRRALGEALGGLLGSGRLDTPFWEGVEEALLASDLGIKTAASVVEAVRHSQPKDAAGVASGLRTELLSMLDGKDRAMARRRAPSVVLVVGVNGVGKTTPMPNSEYGPTGWESTWWEARKAPTRPQWPSMLSPPPAPGTKTW